MIRTQQVAVAEESGLVRLVKSAADHLASATSAAQVLEARDAASVAYDAAKKAARLAKAKGAHDELIAKAHRAQADALLIESEAKRRLADEYDAARERGEVAGQGKPSKAEGFATVADIGLTHKDIHEARTIRDAEAAQPGIVKETLDAKLAAGEEPTKAAVREAVQKATGKAAATPKPPARTVVLLAEFEAVEAERDELREENAALREDVAKLTAEIATYADMKLEYDRGGFEAILANKDQVINAQAAAIARESQEKVRNLNTSEMWRKRAEEAGWSNDVVIPIPGRAAHG